MNESLTTRTDANEALPAVGQWESGTIVALKAGEEYSRLTLQDGETTARFVLLTDDVLELRLQPGQTVDNKLYQELSRRHAYCYCYRKAVRRLTVKDQSVAEIRKLLAGQQNLTAQQREAVIAALRDKGYLDDAALAAEQFAWDQARLIGSRRTAYDLERRGVDQALIDAQLGRLDRQQEIERCQQKARLIWPALQHLSQREALGQLRKRLTAAGYPRDTMEEAITTLELPADPEVQQRNLRAAYEKAARHYGRLADGRQRRRRIYTYLLSKGYPADEIAAVMPREDDEDED
jgi:SOS response regulatory protein OraA/RecX